MIQPSTKHEANAYIKVHHRHHKPVHGLRFALKLVGPEQEILGVAVVGRPVARMLDDGLTAEVTRLCTEGTPNACSRLYGAAARACKEMGFRSIITYTLATEPGVSLRASGWRRAAETTGGEWDRGTRRRRAADNSGPKVRWERRL